MDGQSEGRRKLPVKMKLREGGEPAQRFQIQIAVEMPVDMIQNPLHPDMVVLKRRLHRFVLHGSPI
jgi:hypothetical protein